MDDVDVAPAPSSGTGSTVGIGHPHHHCFSFLCRLHRILPLRSIAAQSPYCLPLSLFIRAEFLIALLSASAHCMYRWCLFKQVSGDGLSGLAVCGFGGYFRFAVARRVFLSASGKQRQSMPSSCQLSHSLHMTSISLCR